MFRFAGLACALLLALPSQAAEKPVLTVYTYDSIAAEWGAGPALAKGFEAQCGCKVTYVAVEEAITAVRRVQLEGPTTKADVILGLDNFFVGEARATDLFEPHGVDLSALSLAWDDPLFVPFDRGYFAYIYNKEKLADPPNSFLELIALPENFKIVVMDPRSSTPGFGHLAWIRAAYGDKAGEIWSGLKPHLLSMTRGWSEGYNLFLNGEADMVLSYTTSPPYHLITDKDARYAFAEFSEGYLEQIEVSGILKTSPNKELARQFLAYLLTPEAQNAIPTANWAYPVVDIGGALPPEFPPEPKNLLKLAEQDVLEKRDAWIEEALGALR